MKLAITDRKMIGLAVLTYGLSTGLNGVLTTLALKQYMNPANGLI